MCCRGSLAEVLFPCLGDSFICETYVPYARTHVSDSARMPTRRLPPHVYNSRDLSTIPDTLFSTSCVVPTAHALLYMSHMRMRPKNIAVCHCSVTLVGFVE